MTFPYDSPGEDYEAHSDIRCRCRKCYGYSRNLEDGYCPRCNGEEPDPNDNPAKRVWDKFYAEHPRFKR